MVNSNSSEPRDESIFETPKRVESDLSSQRDKYSPKKSKNRSILPSSIDIAVEHKIPVTASPKDVISIHCTSEEDDLRFDKAIELRENIEIEVSPSRRFSSLQALSTEHSQKQQFHEDATDNLNESHDAIKIEENALLALKEASDNIGSMMQDLDELRFFHELDIESSPSVVFKSRVPQKFLSPRYLSSMKRSALELEAQELQRKLDIAYAEKQELSMKNQMYEQQAKSRGEEGEKINTLEKKLIAVRNTVSEQVEKINQSRAQLIEEFEGKMNLVNDNNRLLRTEAEIMIIDFSKTMAKYDIQLNGITDELMEAQENLSNRNTENENMQQEIVELRLELDAFKRKLTESRNILQDRELDYIELSKKHTDNLSVLSSKEKEIRTLKEKIMKQKKKVEGLQKTIEDFVEREQMRSLMCGFS